MLHSGILEVSVKKHKHNIILIGFMGSGKTSVGELLAKRMSYHFKDTDRMIETKEQETINQIFNLKGEEYFRNLETGLIMDMQSVLHHTVLSTGGGMPIRAENRNLLKQLGFVVYLKASAETTVARLRKDKTRPLLQGEDLKEKVNRMLLERRSLYEKTAHKVIDTDDKNPEEITEHIMEAYLKYIY